MAVTFEGGLLVLAFVLGWLTGIAPLRHLRFSAPGVMAGAATGLGLLVILTLATRTEWPPLARLEDIVREFVDQFFARATLLDLALVSALAGVAEEALFRGILQGAFLSVVGTVPAVAAAALLFGLAHFITATYAVAATLIGALLGALLVATGDLAAPIVAHALYDFLALAWLVRTADHAPRTRGPDAPESTS
ncbi:MAG: CPBP family glutamic-type intramembrane protease [Gemmatimonadota bacterium]